MESRTALEAATAIGATGLVDAMGARLALDYGDRAAEYAALTNDVGLVDLGQRTQIEVTGRDRAGFLNRFVTNKVDDLADGRGREAFLTDAKGHVAAWLLVLARPEALVLDADPGLVERILAHLSYYRIREDVAFSDRSTQWAELMLAGPNAGQVLARLGASPPPPRHLSHTPTTLAAAPVSLCHVDLGSREVVWIRCDYRAAREVWLAVLDAGAKPCGRQAAEAVRIESGWPQYGRDVTEANLPQEVGRDRRAISFQKGCYLGQETVARLDSRGHVNKRLVGLRLAAEQVPPDATPLVAADRPAGTVTSAAPGPNRGQIVALGYVRRGLDRSAAELSCRYGRVEVVELGPAETGAR